MTSSTPAGCGLTWLPLGERHLLAAHYQLGVFVQVHDLRRHVAEKNLLCRPRV